jgi:hypothetical protein
MEPFNPEAPRFTSAEVCVAARVSRGTFDAWLLRRYLPLPPGPGTGRVRKFSFVDVVRVAVVAELNRQGFSVSKAAAYIDRIDVEFRAAMAGASNHETVLMITEGKGGNKYVRIGNSRTLTTFFAGLGFTPGLGRTVFYSILLLGNLIENVREALNVSELLPEPSAPAAVADPSPRRERPTRPRRVK